MTTVFQDRELAVDYRYFVVDIMSNELLAEIPFTGVSYSRSLREAGEFSGSIAITEATANLSLYENTLPGKTALYVVRNNVCVWGGIVWTRSYDIVGKSLSVSASEFSSYFYKRVLWKTWVNAYQASIVVSGSPSVVDITLDFAEASSIAAGRPVYIDWGEDHSAYNGYYVPLSSPAPGLTVDGRTTFSVANGYVAGNGDAKTIPDMTLKGTATVEVNQDTYDYARQLFTELETDLFDFDFPNDAIRPGIDVFNTIDTYSRSGNVAFITLNQPHQLIAGQRISITDADNGFDDLEATVLSAPTPLTLSYANTGPNVATTNAADTVRLINFWQRDQSIVTVTTFNPHGFKKDDIVYIDSLNASVNGYHKILVDDVEDSGTYFKIASLGSDLGISFAGESGATATVSPAVNYSTWGEFTQNGDLDMGYSSELPSQKLQQAEPVRGFELKSVGEILEEYSNVANGFEYRIDCSYDLATNSFTRTFVFLPLFPTSLKEYIDSLPGGVLPPGEFAPVSAYGADEYVFEYPGNILNATLEENAQEAATRFWVQGSDSTLSSDASQPYSGAADVDLLSRGWPLLEEVEKVDKVAEESTLYERAKRFLAEAKPPISNFTISVNGSLTPIVASYKPGDWCSVIINDDFVKLRLTSYIELNDGTGREVLLRKIDAYSVSVPDNPTFPEQVDLQLVTEAEVDKIGDPTS
jgi:hypothetical protein